MTADLQNSETKKKMADALKKLVKNKAFTKITVSEICTECSINRNTFYYYFENMYDLLYWVYDQEIKNIVTSFQCSNSNVTKVLKFIFEYIDNNIQLCQAAYESLGEQELKILFENDINSFLTAAIAYTEKTDICSISEDFKNFLTFNFTAMVGSQTVWYIKYNENLDKAKYLDYAQTTLYASLKNTISEAAAKNL